ncbi:MAG: 4Fe-4S dicluster domain-containing protein [Desulfobacterota bacterium]|nr:4Fe-4S dicluster domain-containing protein [Thermodesulfobacteriota bacterium]
MDEKKGLTRRNFLKKGALLTAVGAASAAGVPQPANAKAGTYATMIDLTRCDGCKSEPIPRCVEACRRENERKFPEPKGPIKDLWPQKTHDDWSKRRDVTDQLTPYNWTTVQKVAIEGEEIFLPRRCMHCDNPPCANLCPFGALNKYPDGSVVIDPGLCMGGAKCKAVCPWQIPQRQSGVGLYLKLQPMPAGGGVMYKCDLCHDRIQTGRMPACVEACEKRLGEKKPLHFGRRETILKMAHERAREVNGFIYGEKENGGTATLYVSRVPFEKIDAALKGAKSKLHMGKVLNPLREVNGWAMGFWIAPLLSGLAALGLAIYHQRGEKEEK